MKQSAAPSRASFIASYLIMAILVLLPFYALLTTWAASNFGHFDLFRIIKELLMIPLGLYAAVLVVQHKRLQEQLRSSMLCWFIVGYSLLFIGAAMIVWLGRDVTANAIAYSLITNLRFLWFMGVVWVITSLNPYLYQHWLKIVLIPASLAVGFGLLQKFLLPIDFLRHFGYGPNTVDAVQTVDQKLDFRRIQSSLRGANPFGAYLVIPITAAVAYVRKKKFLWIFIVASLVALFFSYSRSAWAGVIVSLAVLLWRTQAIQKFHKQIAVAAIIVIVILTAGVWLLRDNDTVQNAVFHSDETSQSAVSSNEQRFAAVKLASQDVWNHPFGQGPGSAGPASFRNNNSPKIAENYYLQLGQEVGFIGIVLFGSITVLVGWALWRRDSPLAQVLLASLVGIVVINLVSHAWTDETLALLWWGLAGMALSAPVILKKS